MSDIPAIWTHQQPVELVRIIEGVTTIGNPALEDVWSPEVAGAYLPELLWRLSRTPGGTPVRGLRDDNRTVLLPESRVIRDGREFVLAVKGCGAEFDAYQPRRLTAALLREICHDPELRAALAAEDGKAAPFIVGERWWGFAPYGGQACDNALLGLLTSLRARFDSIAGFRICPVVAAVQLPPAVADLCSKFFWYRRYDGTYWQEVRLMPSNVRLYFHSPVTLGLDAGKVFRLCDLSSFERCESFALNLTRSTIAAITLFGRSVRYDEGRGAYFGLDYDDVFLDKDAVIAADGTLYFADLEGVEAFAAADPARVRERMEWQYYRNVYEATFALEAMAIEAWSSFGLAGGHPERRAWVEALVERACRGDPYVTTERRGDRLTLQLEGAVDPSDCHVELEWASGGA